MDANHRKYRVDAGCSLRDGVYRPSNWNGGKKKNTRTNMLTTLLENSVLLFGAEFHNTKVFAFYFKKAA